MAYDESSPYGDIICENFDEKNNFMNPISDTGWFIYNLFGKSFDSLSERVSQMVLNMNPIRCEDSYLDLLAKELKLKKNSNWTNDQYRAYIILHTYNVMTVAGLEYVLNQIAIGESDEINGLITVSYEKSGFRASDEYHENELTSDEFNEKDLLESFKSELIQIEIPIGVNRDLINFICQYLPYEVNIT